MPRTFYLHTFMGQPAFFSERSGQIVMARRSHPAVLRATLREIRADQRRTAEFRERNFYRVEARDYGYVRVVLPADGGGAS